MKNKIVFALLTVLAAAAGLKLSSLSNVFLGRNDDGKINVDRGSIRTDALYIAQNEDDLANAFSRSFDIDGAVPLKHSEYDKLCQAKLSEIAEIVVAELCACRAEYSIAKPAGKSIAESLLTDRSDKIALKKFPYYNPAGELRYLDLTADKEEFYIQYIRFYSDEPDERLSADEIEQAISRITDDTTRFSDALKGYGDSIAWLSGGEYQSSDLYLDKTAEDFVLEAEGKTREELLEEIGVRLAETKDYCRENCDAPGSVSAFARDLSSSSLARLRFRKEGADYPDYVSFGGASIYAELINVLADETSIANLSAYSAYRDEIYQTLSYEDAIELVTIFNARTQAPEGFFISDFDSQW